MNKSINICIDKYINNLPNLYELIIKINQCNELKDLCIILSDIYSCDHFYIFSIGIKNNIICKFNQDLYNDIIWPENQKPNIQNIPVNKQYIYEINLGESNEINYKIYFIYKSVENNLNDNILNDNILNDNILNDNNLVISTINANLQKILYKKKYDQQIFKQQNMLSNMCHTIRTPLNAIMYLVENLDEDNIILLQKSILSLSTNIIDVIDMSKLELNKFEVKNNTFKLVSMIESIIDISNSLILPNNNIEINFYIDPIVPIYIYSDEYRIKQIIINLLENSINNFKAIDKDHHKICINVNDIQINEKENSISFIINDFNNFNDFNTESTNQSINQSINQGFRLQMCYLISEKLNGNLELKKSESFNYYELNIIYQKNINVVHILNNDNIHILIVEDDYLSRIVLEKILKKIKYKNINSCKNGIEALLNIKSFNYDIILIDIRMPYMTGFELADKIHEYCLENDRLNPRMIAVTAQLIDEKDFRPWFNEVIYKPIKQSELKNILTN